MSKQYAQIPQYEVSLHSQGKLTTTWRRFFTDLYEGNPSGGESPVTAGTSPFTYTAPQGGALIVQGGTVSLITFGRTTTNYPTGQTAGMFPLSKGDFLIIHYSAAPTLTWVPQ